jgi:UPF0716 protein FxsA
MPLLLLLALFIVVPIAELYVIIRVGGEIGVLPTVLILVVDSVLGSVLLRSQGRSAWRRFNRAMAERRIPHAEIVDGVLVIFGGALLLTPGFLTDVVGLLLLIPASRAVARRLLIRALGRRVLVGVAGGMRASPAPQGPRPARPFDVEGSATEERPSPPSAVRAEGADGADAGAPRPPR